MRVFWVSARKPVLAALRSNNQTWLLRPHLLPHFPALQEKIDFPTAHKRQGQG